jgi:hypothetical protein
VSCEGENPADVENIGPIQYIPRRGFPGYFFPLTNKEDYLSPLVAVWFRKPTSKYEFYPMLSSLKHKEKAEGIPYTKVKL